MTTKDKILFLLEKGFSYGMLGKICKCHSSSISKWINGEINISIRLEESIENHLKTFVKELFQTIEGDLNGS